MLSNEKIIYAVEPFYIDKNEYTISNIPKCYLQIAYNFCLYVEQGAYLLLETESSYITIGYEGVKIYENKNELPQASKCISDEKEAICEFPHEYAVNTILKGQFIEGIEKHHDYYVVYFSESKLYVYKCEKKNKETRELSHIDCSNDVPIVDCPHLFSRNCDCGGKPEIIRDFVNDFEVRCRDCHKSTYASSLLKSAVEDWNNENINCAFDTSWECFNKQIANEKIKYIAFNIENDYSEDTVDCFECKDVVIAFDDGGYIIKPQLYDYEKVVIAHKCFSDYNHVFYPLVIKPKKEIRCIEQYDSYFWDGILLDIDGVKISLEPTFSSIIVNFEGLNTVGVDAFRNMIKERNWQWAVVGNIVKTRVDKDGILRYGTSAFTGGTKVYLYGKCWTSNQDTIGAIGLNRQSRLYRYSDVPVDAVENIRLQQVYKPAVLALMNDFEFWDGWWQNTDEDRADAVQFIKRWNEAHVK